MYNPISTYRIQFHQGFTFTDFEQIIPYLETLGISTVYASPIFQSTPGSMHGYDGVNPLQINPEIGTIEQLRRISKKLRGKNIGWLQDIVPNHMAFHQDNTWLMDVLEKGEQSKHYTYFDYNTGSLYQGPIMAPFLGNNLDVVIKNGELKVIYNDGQFCFDYFDHRWPLNASAYRTILDRIKTKRPDGITQLIQADLSIDDLKNSLAIIGKTREAASFIRKCINSVNTDTALLQQLAEQQHYRLCNWQETDHTINYRRFFTVNSLICLNIHQQDVFDEFHQLIAELTKEGVFQGLRIDHIDGLFDPERYLQQLRSLVGDETYLIVEKILEPGEVMPRWPIQGNTGYDFLSTVNNLLAGTHGQTLLMQFYQQLINSDAAVAGQITEKKRYILNRHMNGEWDNLVHLLQQTGITETKTYSHINQNNIKQVIGEFLIACPVYRFYGNKLPLKKGEAKEIHHILKQIKQQNPELKGAIKLLKNIFLGDNKDGQLLYFYQRCMQFTGPLMAKGVEDTLMYTYNSFLAHNEVGDSPDAKGISISNFHQQMIDRQHHWPLSLNGTATHDTKRGEDVRARLQVIPAMVERWIQTVQSWQNLNADLNPNNQPDANDEYFIYQALISTYPMPGESEADFSDRFSAYLEKVMREAKQHSDWAQPNEEYETATKNFAKSLLNKQRPFWKSFTDLHQTIADHGIINSLAQVLLKFTCPGIPDVYQGCENWDFSFVDPDNRRQVDYKLRQNLLASADSTLLETLWQNRLNGQVKLWLTETLANERKLNKRAFTEGEYLPLNVEGKYKDHVLAFARVHKSGTYIIVVPLQAVMLREIQHKPILEINWEDTAINLPKSIKGKLHNLLLKTDTEELHVQSLFAKLPLAVLKVHHPENKRSAGILLAISSLPSKFGIGDFGPAAKQFADMLYANDQRYWQLLPLNPVSASQQYSPYSSHASFAGNELFISPDLLVNEGLLASQDIEHHNQPETSQVDYATAEQVKHQLLHQAWLNYKDGQSAHLEKPFQEFCKREAYWLDDYALYLHLRAVHNQPWHQWPDHYKLRDANKLKAFAKRHRNDLDKSKFLQFLFISQWKQLKAYCNELNIQLFGDLPFYVSYDSADVWANPQLFSLDEQGQMLQVAGVPPDYFNANGQLWGMPVFCWDELKRTEYKWWINRIKKNLQYFDLLRLDHFRAFSSYWAVPANETTAINGVWEQAPGKDFLQSLKNELSTLPFVAEDLGDINDAVYALRDEFNLPGMKVLQFAFGDDLANSPHIPHNYSENFIIYTGTHDNNTTRGWYDDETNKIVRKQINNYTGKTDSRKIAKVFIKTALASVAKMAIIPMQDWLNLGKDARMNTPASIENNWQWKLTSKQLDEMPDKIGKWSKLYGRD